MAIVPIDAPGVENALVVNKLVTGAPDVVHDFVLAAFLDRLADASPKVVQHLIPRDALPFAFAAFTRPPQRVQDALRIGYLIDGCRPFGEVTSPTARMRRIAFKLLDAHRFFVYVSKQPAGSFAVEADCRDERVMPLDSPWPLPGIVFRPVMPAVGR